MGSLPGWWAGCFLPCSLIASNELIEFVKHTELLSSVVAAKQLISPVCQVFLDIMCVTYIVMTALQLKNTKEQSTIYKDSV